MLRSPMLIHLDENAPESVGAIFRERGHEVQSVRVHLATGTPDPAVAVAAMETGAIVVTWDQDFTRLIKRKSTKYAYRTLSAVIFRLGPTGQLHGAARTAEVIDYIEFAYERAFLRGERLVMEVLQTQVNILTPEPPDDATDS